MKKRITSMICIVALLVTASQTITVEGKSKSQKLLPAKQISETVNSKSVNQGGTLRTAGNVQTFAISSQVLYNTLTTGAEGIIPKSAITDKNDATKTIELDMEQVEAIMLQESVSQLTDADKSNLQTLLAGCTNLQRLNLGGCDLSGLDLSVLNNRNSLTRLYLYRCGLRSVPDLTLTNLKGLVLSRNLLTDESVANLTSTKLPSLTALYLDACQISDLGFLENLQ